MPAGMDLPRWFVNRVTLISRLRYQLNLSRSFLYNIMISLCYCGLD